MKKDILIDLYKKMYKIRRYEESVLELFSENILHGTTHTCIGQESIAVASMANIEENDIVFSNHRCHGHFIAYSNNIKILLAEMMGKGSGVCRGRGGSQHLCYKRFFSNGIQGGIVPNAVGMAWAEKIKGTRNIAVVFMGDGTLGEGIVYESLNMASIFEIPILFIVENNEYAMSTKREEVFAGTIKERFRSFNIECSEVSDNNIEVLYDHFAKAVSYVREEKRPFCQIVNTYRLAAHSKGDDYRNKDEIKQHWLADPLKKVENLIDMGVVNKIKNQIDLEIKETIQFCKNDEEVYEKKLSDDRRIMENATVEECLLNRESIKNVYQLNKAIKSLVQSNSRILLLGEDIKDPYGGAFKVTSGISKEFPEQVINTPISEAGFIGISIGLAMNGMRPIVEIMFSDFISLGFDQILNHAAKYCWMYDNQVTVPLLIRMPSGGGRGYGATHSQSLEKYFVGIPDLNIFALSPIVDCTKLLSKIESEIKGPTLLVENKKMYGNMQMTVEGNRVDKFYIEEIKDKFPMYKLTLDENEEAEVVIITYGEMLSMAMQVAKKLLIEDEILVNVISLIMISPINYVQLVAGISDEKYIFTLEEGNRRAGWGAEVISGLCEKLYGRFFYKIGAENSVISCNRNEERQMLPEINNVYDTIKGVIYETENHKNAASWQ